MDREHNSREKQSLQDHEHCDQVDNEVCSPNIKKRGNLRKKCVCKKPRKEKYRNLEIKPAVRSRDSPVSQILSLFDLAKINGCKYLAQVE